MKHTVLIKGGANQTYSCTQYKMSTQHVLSSSLIQHQQLRTLKDKHYLNLNAKIINFYKD